MPTVGIDFEGNEADLVNSFDRVGAASEDMASAVDDSGDKMVRSSAAIDGLSERADTAETRFTGFYDTLGGTSDALAAFGDDSLSTTDKMIALGQAGADLAGGFTGFVIPVLGQMWQRLISSTIATHALTAAKVTMTAVTNGAAIAMQFLNAVIRANPVMFLVGLIFVLVTAFLALWTRSEGFRNFFIGMWNGIRTTVSNVVTGIRNGFNGVVDFFRTLPQRIGSALGSLGSVIGSVFKGAVNVMIDGLNWGIDRINDLIYGANLVNPFADIPAIPKIARLHTGGIVPGTPGQEVPIIAMAGERVSMKGQGSGGEMTVRVAPGADKGVAELINWLIRKGYIRFEGGV